VGIAAVAERRRNRTSIERHLAHGVVDFRGGDSRADDRHQRVENLCRQPACAPHAVEPGRSVKLDRAVARLHLGVVDGQVVGHRAGL
jgi:hypothetical protein